MNRIELTMEYYVARDKNRALFLYCGMPNRDMDNEVWGDSQYLALPSTLFPDLKWDDEPIEVELTLKEVGK